MLELLLLPFKLALTLILAILFLPFLLLRIAIKLFLALVLLPLVLAMAALGVLLGIAAFFFAVLIPLLPIAFVAFLVWAIVRASSRPELYRA